MPPAFQPGKKYQYSMHQKVAMDMTAVGKAVGQEGFGGKTEINISMDLESVCKKHSTPGQIVVTTKYTRVAMDMNMGPMAMKYDSADPATAESPISKQLKPLLDLAIEVIYNDKNEIVEVKGFEKMQGMQQFSKEQILQMFDPARVLGIPAEGVAIGETWGSTTDMAMGQKIGSLEMETDSTYEKDETVDGKKLAILSYTSRAKGDLEKTGVAGAVDVEFNGTIKFDKANRVAKESKATGTLRMKMKNPADPEKTLEIPAEITQSFVTKSITAAD